MSLKASEVYIKTSGFDDLKKLLIRSVCAEFDEYFPGTSRKLLFNGSVAGSIDEVVQLIKKARGELSAAGFSPKLKVYDENFNCIEEFNV